MIKRPHTVAVLLLCVLLLLLVLLANRWIDRHGQMRAVTRWTSPAPVPAVIEPVSIKEPVGVGVDRVQLAETTERPLFAFDRRLPPPPPPPAPPTPPPPPDALNGAHLFGVVAGADGAAIVRAQGKVQTLRLDQTLGQWTLKALEPGLARFERGEEQRTLSVQFVRLGEAPARSASAGNQAASNRSNLTQAEMPEAMRQEADERARRKAELRARMQSR